MPCQKRVHQEQCLFHDHDQQRDHDRDTIQGILKQFKIFQILFTYKKLILSKFLIYFQSLKSIDKFIQGTLQTYTKDDVEDVRCADDGYPTDDQLVMPSAARSTNLPNRFARGISTNSKLSL